MNTQLDRILLEKQKEVEQLRNLIHRQTQHPIAQILEGKMKRTSKKSFKKALNHPSLAVIAEIKRCSPSKGFLAKIPDPVLLAQNYIAAGANAISILTDELFFGGTLRDLSEVAFALSHHPHPVLRKDFIIDEIQIAQAIQAGADAILCIVAVLGNKLPSFLACAQAMNIEVLVEVHHQQELHLALESGAEMIGVNNRHLSTFEVDLNRALKLMPYIPKTMVSVAESGISNPEIAQEYAHAGFSAVLIGEALVQSNQPEHFIRACRHA